MIQVNPDNIATPVAASLGDLITLLLLAAVATGLNFMRGLCRAFIPNIYTTACLKNNDNIIIESPFPTILMVLLLSLLPLWVFIVFSNEHVRDILHSGWTPLLAAMGISTVGGLVLEKYIARYVGLAVLVPVMNGKPWTSLVIILINN
jgi:solute carrier family 41